MGRSGRGHDVDILSSKVVAHTYVNWGPFLVDPWMSTWFCTNRMLDLWGLVNRHWSMIVVVGWYPTIPLEMFTEIVYEKTLTRERWDLDRPYDTVAKGCHTWPVCGHVYVVLDKFIPLQGWLLIWIPLHSRIWVIASSLPPLIEMHVYYYDDGLRWLINDGDDDYITMLIYFIVMLVILNVIASHFTYIHV
jgi:hypothetical protein